MDLSDASRINVRLPSPVVHVAENTPPGVSVTNLLTEVGGKVFTGSGAPAGVPVGALPGANYVDLDSGDWYKLEATMDWTPIGNIQGPAGDELTPAEMQQLIDDAEAEVLASLEPPIDLTILFYNALA